MLLRAGTLLLFLFLVAQLLLLLHREAGNNLASPVVNEAPAGQPVVVQDAKVVKDRLSHRVIVLDVSDVRLMNLILFIVHFLPVDVAEELMFFDVFSTSCSGADTSLRIPVQE